MYILRYREDTIAQGGGRQRWVDKILNATTDEDAMREGREEFTKLLNDPHYTTYHDDGGRFFYSVSIGDARVVFVRELIILTSPC